MIWVQNQLVGAREGQRLTLECASEAFPKSINYWTRDKDKIVPQGECLPTVKLLVTPERSPVFSEQISAIEKPETNSGLLRVEMPF